MQGIEHSIRMIEFEVVSAAIVLGFAAAVSPGPLLALLISETIKYGKKEGVAVSVSPLFTDFPIFIFSYFAVYRQIYSIYQLFEILYIIGGIVLIYFGYKNIKYHYKTFNHVKTEKGIVSAFVKGFIINLFNPYTYIFWFGVAINFFSEDFFHTFIFFISFFIAFLITEFTIIIFVDKSKKFVDKNIYTAIIKFVGLVFFILGLNLLYLAFRQIF